MTKVLYYTLGVCFFGWIGITAYLVIANALTQPHIPYIKPWDRYEDFQKIVDSVNEYRSRPYVDSATQKLKFRIEPVNEIEKP